MYETVLGCRKFDSVLLQVFQCAYQLYVFIFDACSSRFLQHIFTALLLLYADFPSFMLSPVM